MNSTCAPTVPTFIQGPADGLKYDESKAIPEIGDRLDYNGSGSIYEFNGNDFQFIGWNVKKGRKEIFYSYPSTNSDIEDN